MPCQNDMLCNAGNRNGMWKAVRRRLSNKHTRNVYNAFNDIFLMLAHGLVNIPRCRTLLDNA